jgi:hypothetical protein
MAVRAEHCARVLRNYPSASPECKAAADAFVEFAKCASLVARHLLRNTTAEANEHVNELNAALYKCRQLTGVAVIAIGPAVTS